jgi:hypothetical protein
MCVCVRRERERERESERERVVCFSEAIHMPNPSDVTDASVLRC